MEIKNGDYLNHHFLLKCIAGKRIADNSRAIRFKIIVLFWQFLFVYWCRPQRNIQTYTNQRLWLKF